MTQYAKGYGFTQVDNVWHVVTESLLTGNCVAVACGYPVVPDCPRLSGRFQPSAVLGTSSEPLDPVCDECKDILFSEPVDVGFEAFCAEESEL